MKKIILLFSVCISILAISCKKENTTNTTIAFADEIKDYYIAIDNIDNGFGVVYFEKNGDVFIANYRDLATNISFNINSNGFEISGDSSISMAVSSTKTLNLKFKRNSSNQILLDNCSTTTKSGANFLLINRYAEMYKKADAPVFYVQNRSATESITYYTPSFNSDYSYYYKFTYINNLEIEIKNVLFSKSYLNSIIYGNIGFFSNDAGALGISVATWKGNNLKSLLVQTKDEAGVDFRNRHDVAILLQ